MWALRLKYLTIQELTIFLHKKAYLKDLMTKLKAHKNIYNRKNRPNTHIINV